MAITDRTRPGPVRRRPQQRRPQAPPSPPAGAEYGPVTPPAPAPEPAPAVAPEPPPAAPLPETTVAPHTALDQVSGGRLLVYDARMALLLLNEARYRALQQLLGVPREQANLVTLVGLGLVAHTVHERVGRLLHAPFAGSPADAVLPLAATREILYDVAGPASRQTPYFGALVALAVAARVSGPSIRATVHSARSAAHGIRVAFRHRYGHTPMRAPTT